MSLFLDFMVERDGFDSSETVTNLEFKELRQKMVEGDPTKEDSDRYQELIDSGLIDNDLINAQSVQDDSELSPQQITRWEHEDRPSDDRLRQLTYDGASEPDWLPEFSIGSSITYAGDGFKWLGTVIQSKKPVFIPDSPFVKGDKEVNAMIYKYVSLCIDSRIFARVEGVKKGRILNYLTCFVSIPHCIPLKENKKAKYLKFFLFGEVVNRYRENVIARFPKLRKNRNTFHEESRILPKCPLLDLIYFS